MLNQYANIFHAIKKMSTEGISELKYGDEYNYLYYTLSGNTEDEFTLTFEMYDDSNDVELIIWQEHLITPILPSSVQVEEWASMYPYAHFTLVPHETYGVVTSIIEPVEKAIVPCLDTLYSVIYPVIEYSMPFEDTSQYRHATATMNFKVLGRSNGMPL
jgi:hypothetical protein